MKGTLEEFPEFIDKRRRRAEKNNKSVTARQSNMNLGLTTSNVTLTSKNQSRNIPTQLTTFQSSQGMNETRRQINKNLNINLNTQSSPYTAIKQADQPTITNIDTHKGYATNLTNNQQSSVSFMPAFGNNDQLGVQDDTGFGEIIKNPS